jgi:hypothetical protein
MNTPEYWDKKWREQHAAYAQDPRRDSVYKAILEEMPEGKAILDLGGGCSRFSRLAKEKGHKPTVADLSSWAIEHNAEDGIDGFVLDVTGYEDEKLGKYDVGVCTELLEHLDSPVKALRLLNKHVSEAWISVPNNRMGPHECAEHKRTYNLVEFAELLQGFYLEVDVKDVNGYLLAHVSSPHDLPLISVLIPSCGRKSIDQTLQSLYWQTFKDWEAIVVYNNITEERAFSGDPRVRFVDLGEIPNDTGATARNIGFEQARGLFIGTLDDDDWWDPSFLWVMKREIVKHKDVDLLYCRTNLWIRDGSVMYGSWFKEFDADLLPKAGYILSPSVIFRRKMLEDYKLHADADGRNSDWRFYVDSHRAGFVFGAIDKQLANLSVDEKIWQKWAPGGFRA